MLSDWSDLKNAATDIVQQVADLKERGLWVNEHQAASDSLARFYLSHVSLDTTPITEEWAATVRGEGVHIVSCLGPYNEMAWLLSYHDDAGWEMVRCIVKTQGEVLGILNAVRPQKVGE